MATSTTEDVHLLFIWRANVMPADGLVTLPSSHGPSETMSRLEAVVKTKGMSVLARIDHAAGAAKIGASLRPTEVLIFGNPKGGTPLMQSAQTIGLDLPLRALVWQDASGQTFLSYNDPVWLAKRHAVGRDVAVSVTTLSVTLDTVARVATSAP